MRVGCCFEVPRKIMTKRAVINVLSMDNACFVWSSFCIQLKETRIVIFLLTLYDDTEFAKYRISYKVKKRNENRTWILNESINVYSIEG